MEDARSGGWKPRGSGPSPELAAEREARRRVDCAGLRRACGVDAIFVDADLRRLRAELPPAYRRMAATLLKMLDAPGLMAIGGERGTGKTWLASGLVHAFCAAGRPAIYRRTKAFFDELATAEWTGKEQVRRRYVLPALLVLDEVQVRDAERQWQDNELTSLLDRRYAAGKATLLVSNLSPADLANNLGESVHRRLIEGHGILEAGWRRVHEILKAH